ncbi:MAG TPA: phospholipid carrier-dependent glycosyltransferase [Urbifossiella sp.]|nr:phospholipid carrier-dependent glycosyltransferase [Urbifossiella sp.]
MSAADSSTSRDRQGAAAPTPVPLTQIVDHSSRSLAVAARGRVWVPLLAVAGVVALFTVGLGRRELVSSHEARAAQNAQRMLDTGEWGLPVLFDGRVDLQKPPGYYWLVAAAGWANGGVVTEFTARLPAALAGLLTVALVYGWLRREGRPVAALVAALTLATAGHFTAISRTARIDVPLTAVVACALVAFYRGTTTNEAGEPTAVRRRVSGASPAALRRSARLASFLLAALAAAVGVLLKGPVALALVGPAAVAWLMVKPRGGGLPVPAALLGVAVVLAVTAPWFLWANGATGGEFVRVFFWHHNVERFAGTSPTLASHPAWYYLPRFAADFLPWTPALALLTWWAVRAGSWRADPLFRFGAVWCVTMFAVLSAAQFKRADYLLPLYPGAAVVLGCAAERWLAARPDPRTVRRAGWAFALVLAGVVAAWGVMAAVVEPAEEAREGKRAFAEFIRSRAPAPEPVLVFRAESHLLSFHLGVPQSNRVEWHDLAAFLAEPGPRFVVMSAEYVYAAGEIVKTRRLVEVGRLEQFTGGRPPKSLVFLRTADD